MVFWYLWGKGSIDHTMTIPVQSNLRIIKVFFNGFSLQESQGFFLVRFIFNIAVFHV